MQLWNILVIWNYYRTLTHSIIAEGVVAGLVVDPETLKVDVDIDSVVVELDLEIIIEDNCEILKAKTLDSKIQKILGSF